MFERIKDGVGCLVVGVVAVIIAYAIDNFSSVLVQAVSR